MATPPAVAAIWANIDGCWGAAIAGATAVGAGLAATARGGAAATARGGAAAIGGGERAICLYKEEKRLN